MRASLSGLHVLLSTEAARGLWGYTLELAAGLSGRGVSTTLAVLGPAPSPEQTASAAAIAECRLVVTGLSLDPAAPDGTALREAADAIAGLAWRLQADIAHLHDPALIAGGGIPIPTVVTCHDCAATRWATLEEAPLSPDLTWQRDLAAEGLRAADLLIAPTHAFAELTAAAYGLEAPPLVVRPGRRAPGPVSPCQGLPLVLTSGRLWDRGRNLTALDRVAEGLPVPVQAAGSIESPEGERVALQSVQALGPIPAADLAARLAARPIFASLSRYEPFGLGVLEAAQAGCALVLSDIPTFRELWEEAAILVPPDDAAAAERAITGLLADRDRRRRFGEAARARSEQYGREAALDAIAAVYATLSARLPTGVAA
ncbi:glycosyltransferase family 4 protein [Methylobacterium planeticum]|uniref:Glycosyltransferase family 4 protein n=1 Tax=Methylobacterium planeticum TaxID=2615211 RepID=A0A6N6MNJ2_9HYPH|nr:glycosyltransferase family 4 protein [Methylobacterium planeticum]KAB1072853.1 glycosyltransferase family 4 protein [Methylobacterium planeticum]